MVFKEALKAVKLPPSMCQGIITLLPKPNKDYLLSDNWRPITFINTGVKILAHIFAQRKKLSLETIIDDIQSGFMQGWHTSNNIRFILDLIDYKDSIPNNSYILFRYFQSLWHCKAYIVIRSIRFFWFWSILQKSNTNFIQWI